MNAAQRTPELAGAKRIAKDLLTLPIKNMCECAADSAPGDDVFTFACKQPFEQLRIAAPGQAHLAGFEDEAVYQAALEKLKNGLIGDGDDEKKVTILRAAKQSGKSVAVPILCSTFTDAVEVREDDGSRHCPINIALVASRELMSAELLFQNVKDIFTMVWSNYGEPEESMPYELISLLKKEDRQARIASAVVRARADKPVIVFGIANCPTIKDLLAIFEREGVKKGGVAVIINDDCAGEPEAAVSSGLEAIIDTYAASPAVFICTK